MKLSQDQAQALYDFMKFRLENEYPANIAESLLKDIMTKVFKKLRSRLEAFPRRGYSLIMAPEEAKAFYLYWQEVYFSNDQRYEQNLVQSKLGEINKMYA